MDSRAGQLDRIHGAWEQARAKMRDGTARKGLVSIKWCIKTMNE